MANNMSYDEWERELLASKEKDSPKTAMDDYDVWEKELLANRPNPIENTSKSKKEVSDPSFRYTESFDPETGTLFTNDSAGIERAIGSALRGAAKVPGELSDLPFLGHNMRVAYTEGKPKGSTPYDNGVTAADPESGMSWEQDPYLDQGHMSTGLTEKTENLYDRLTNNRYVPHNEEDRFYENVGGFLGSSYLPGGASKLLSGAGKLASKGIPNVVKKGAKQGASKIASKLSSETKDVLKETGSAGKKLFDFLTAKPTKGEAASGLISEYAADTLEKGLDMNDPTQRSLAALLRPLVSIGGGQSLNAVKNVTQKAMLAGIADKSKFDKLTNLGLTPALPDIVKSDTTRGRTIKTIAGRSMIEPLGSQHLHKNLESNINKLSSDLKLTGKKSVDVDSASKALNRAGDKYFEEVNKKAKEYDERYFPKGEAPPLSEILQSKKNYHSLSPQEQIEVYDKYLKDNFQSNEKLTPLQLNKKLDLYTQEHFGAPKEVKKVVFNDPTTKEDILINVLQSPNEHYVSLPKTIEAYHEILNNKRLPAHLKDRIEALSKSQGLMSFDQLDKLRKDFNNVNIPTGNTKFTDKEINQLRHALKTDEVNHLRKFKMDEKAFHEKQKFFRKEYYKQTPKKLAVSPWKEAAKSDSSLELFNTALNDISKHNKMKNIYLNNLNEKDASKVFSNFVKDKFWNENTNDVNLVAFKDYFRKLNKGQKHTWQRLLQKATGNKDIHIQQIFDGLDLLQDSYRHIDTKNSNTLNRLLYKQVPDKGKSVFSEVLSGGGGSLGTALKGSFELAKMALPYLLLRSSNKIMTDPKFLNYVVKGSEVKNVGHFLSWLRNGYDHKFLSKTDMTLLQNAVLKKNSEKNENRKKTRAK